MNIYFALGPAQVYNISDHCIVAILVGRDFELLTGDCQPDFWLSQGFVRTIDCPRWLNWNKLRVWARCHKAISICYFPFAVAISLSMFCLCHVLPYFINETKDPHQRRTKPCYSREIHVPTAYLVTLAKIQDTPARKVARNHSSFVLSFNLIGQHQNKRFYITEIVLPLGFADVTFGWREATTGNTPVSSG